MYKTGLVSISFRANDVAELIAEVKAVGLDCIEWGSDVHAPCDDIDNLEKIAKLQKEYGIYCCSYGTYFRLGTTPLCELEGYIKAAKILGTDILRLWCGDKNSQDYTNAEKEELFSVCKKAAKIACDNGVILCMECHNKTYTNSEKSCVELMQRVNSAHFQMYWQPNQFLSFDDNVSFIKNLSPYVKKVHVFNWEGKNKYPLIDAKSVWQTYLEYIPNYCELLLEFMPDNLLSTLKTETAALKEIVGE